jgi:hypothetical protein
MRDLAVLHLYDQVVPRNVGDFAPLDRDLPGWPRFLLGGLSFDLRHGDCNARDQQEALLRDIVPTVFASAVLFD